jgi:hypothetical protein
MAAKAAAEGTGSPDWTTKEDKRGIDPLGMQTTSIALYQEQLPGISNVTLRMRYYGFYAWLAQTYAKEVGDTSVETWCRYLRRAEALYALIAAHNGGEQGVAGTIWAGGMLRATNRERLVFHSHTDRGDARQYLQQKFGAFGAAYGSQLVEIGVLNYVEGHDVPVPTADTGDNLAQVFRDAIGDLAGVFLTAATAGSVSKSHLSLMAPMLPSRIGKGSRERKLYEDLLFARSHPEFEMAIARNQSLRLILRAAVASGSDVSTYGVRWTLYSNRNENGDVIARLPEDESERQFQWSAYHANDLLHFAYEALLKFTLDVLSVPPTGMPVQQLISKVCTRLLQAVNQRWKASTWADFLAQLALARDAWSEDDEHSEFSLYKAIAEGNDVEGIVDDDYAANALILLAVLHKRWQSELTRVESKCKVLAQGDFVQSVVSEFVFLRENAALPLSELLPNLIKSRIVDRHLWVAMQKFRGQGDYTFLMESDEGRLRVRQKAGPVLTNPRLSSAIAFLKDIHLLGEDGLTSAGLKVLAT